MRVRFSRQADKHYAGLTAQLRAQVDKQVELLRQNFRHPSIQAKKYGGTGDIWQGRVNRGYRFYFHVTDEEYTIIAIIPHPK